MDIGSYLKKCREESGLSLPEVEKETRIKDYILADVERGDFTRTGGYGYSRVTVISFGRAVGADLRRATELFEQCYHAEREQRGSVLKQQPHHKLLLPGNILLILALVVLVAILGGIVLHLHKQGMLNFGQSMLAEEKTTEKAAEQTAKPQAEQPAKAAQTKPDTALQMPASTRQDVDADVAIAKALRDTTDYVSTSVFANPANPMNVSLKRIPGAAKH